MKQTKNLIFGVLSCLLFAVGFTQAAERSVVAEKGTLLAFKDSSPIYPAPPGPSDPTPHAGLFA